MATGSLKRLPFDLYGRYRLASEIAEQVGAGTILDVGGGPGVLDGFCAGVATVAADLAVPRTHEPAPDLVVADGTRLPFADDTFDLVVALDTLEHVEPGLRSGVLRDMARVAQGWVLVAGPCATAGVAEADAALLAFVRAKFTETFETVQTLTEHLVLGHPRPEEIEASLLEAGADVVRFPSGRLDRWLPMMLLFHELLALGRDDPVERLQAWYNELFYRDDLRSPAYRQAILARLPGGDGPSPAAVRDGVLPGADEPPLDVAVFEALRTVLVGSFVDEAETHAAQVAELQVRLADAERRVEQLSARAESAEEHVRILLAFRDRVLSHPAVRLRRGLRRPFSG